MFWDNRKAGLLAMGLCAAMAASLALPISSAHAQSVVVRATGPSAAQYPQGKKLAANASITLKANDRVTVVDKAGTRVLSGPGTFSLDGRVVTDQSPSTRIAGLVSGRSGGVRARTGAVRSAGVAAPVPGEIPRSPNLWYVDVSRPGTYCVADPSAVILWRPDAELEEAASLRGPDGTSADLAWKRGNPLKLWPVESMAVAAGDYVLTRPAGSVTIKTVLIGEAPSDVDDVAATLIAHNCTAQLDQLVEALAAAETATDTPVVG